MELGHKKNWRVYGTGMRRLGEMEIGKKLGKNRENKWGQCECAEQIIGVFEGHLMQ